MAKMRGYREMEDNRISVAGFDWGRVMNLIRNSPNPVACELCNSLIFFMPNAGFINPNEQERLEKELLPALDDYLEQKDNRIRRIYVTELRNHIAELLS